MWECWLHREAQGTRGEGRGASAGNISPLAPNLSPLEDDDDDLPHIPDELSEGGIDTSDDGKTDADIPVAQAYLPSSFGMSFCVDAEAKSIKASASWGQYKRETREEQIDSRTAGPSGCGNAIHEAAAWNCR